MNQRALEESGWLLSKEPITIATELVNIAQEVAKFKLEPEQSKIVAQGIANALVTYAKQRGFRVCWHPRYGVGAACRSA